MEYIFSTVMLTKKSAQYTTTHVQKIGFLFGSCTLSTKS